MKVMEAERQKKEYEKKEMECIQELQKKQD